MKKMEKTKLSVTLDGQDKNKLLMEQIRFANECRRISINLAVQISERKNDSAIKSIIKDAEDIYKWLFDTDFLEALC